MATPIPRTVVEVVDDRDGTPHFAKEVRVNGTPVLLAEDGIVIDFGYNESTIVTLRILATEVHFIHDEPTASITSRDHFDHVHVGWGGGN